MTCGGSPGPTSARRPLQGVGEGSYRFEYYIRRATDRNVTNPHSLPLRVLAEKGVVGALLLLTAIAAAVVAVIRAGRGASDDERRWSSALLAAAAVLLGQSTVDWLWLIPGLAGVAVIVPRNGHRDRRASIRSGSAAHASQSPMGMGEGGAGCRRRARRAAARVGRLRAHGTRDAAGASDRRLELARTAGRLNPWAITPRYLQASALEELGRRAEARDKLLAAL